MNILNKINIARRHLMRTLTKNIGRTDVKIRPGEKVEIKRVLICRPNHRLGNQLLLTPLIEEISSTFPDCKIDLFVKGSLANILFKNYENIDSIIQLPRKPFKHLIQYIMVWAKIKKRRYDVVINIDKNSSSGRLSTQFASSKYKIFGNLEEEVLLQHKDHKHMAKYPVYNFRNLLGKLGFAENNTPVPPLQLRLSAAEIAEGRKKLKELVANDKKTIAIFTYATGDKKYLENWWEQFYQRLKTQYPNYNIIEVLPVENVSQIGFQATAFYSQDIREIGALIANTEIFIGADCGITHLASASQTPTVGLFSVTDPNTYAPYGNGSISINTNNTDADESIRIISKVLHD